MTYLDTTQNPYLDTTLIKPVFVVEKYFKLTRFIEISVRVEDRDPLGLSMDRRKYRTDAYLHFFWIHKYLSVYSIDKPFVSD